MYFLAVGKPHPASSSSRPAALGATASTAATGGSKARPATGGSKVTARGGNTVSAAKLAEDSDALALPKNMRTPVAQWDAGRGGVGLAAVSTQLGSVTQAAGIRQYAAMKLACAPLASAVAPAQAGPPIPDAAMQQVYATALANLAKGAADCRAAISTKPDGDEYINTHQDPKMLYQSMSELTAGVRDLFRVTAEIEIAGLHR